MKISDILSVGQQVGSPVKNHNGSGFQEVLNKAVQNKAVTDEDKKLLDACKQFESIFIYQMLSQMRKSVPESGWLGGDYGEDVYKGMLDEEYSKQMAESGGFGLAQMLFDQLSAQSKSEKGI